MAERIGREEFEEKVLKSGLPVLVDFYSDSCMACKKLAPVLSQAEELLGESIYFYFEIQIMRMSLRRNMRFCPGQH